MGDSTPNNYGRSYGRNYGTIRSLWKNPWTVWVGLRHLRSKNSAFLNFITVLSVLGVAVGVTAMIVVLSVMDGFEAQLKKRLMGSDLHLLIAPKPTLKGFSMGYVPRNSLRKSKLTDALEKEKTVEHVFGVLTAEAILKTGTKVTGVVIKGVDDDKLTRLGAQMVETLSSDEMYETIYKNKKEKRVRRPGVIIGQELAYMMILRPGDFVTLVSPTETQGPLETVPRSKRFIVQGIYSSGLPDQELHQVFAREASVFSFLRRKNVVTQWEVTLNNFESSPAVAARLRKISKDYRISDWIQLNSSLFASLKLERVAMFIVLAFIVIVATFNIVTTLTLMVLEKRKEIAIYKTMGARNAQVGAIFVAEGLLIGGMGVISGVILAFGASVALKRWEFIQLPDIYYDRTLPITFEPLYYIFVAVATFLIVLLGCYYPSRRAAKLHPLDGIRSQ